MKKTVTFIVILFLVSNIFRLQQTSAQTPQKLSYQAIVRNSSNALVTNKQVGMQLSILQGSITGTVVYSEIQTPTTNAFGLVTIEIGGVGFSTIPWANSTYFIKTETDPTGGTNYSITGISQLLAVPYAFQSKTTEGVASMTQFQIDALPPVAGLIVYNSTSKELIFHDGTIWKSILN
ncbi:MAG: hypothetical protein PHO27_10365 [Sulfuricurvum sp.]|nr:hypothetical protein [Sulfuricurvum sp.]